MECVELYHFEGPVHLGGIEAIQQVGHPALEIAHRFAAFLTYVSEVNWEVVLVHFCVTDGSTELECPLALWKCIVHVTTTRNIGNQNNLSINFANIRQKSGESVSDFKRRMTNLLDSFDAIKMVLQMMQ